MLSRISEVIERLAELPAIGREFLDDDLVHGYRMAIVDDYHIINAYNAENSLVQRIVHARRDIDDYAYLELKQAGEERQ